MLTHGTIKHWNDKKGFGFVTPVDGGQDVFFHRNALLNRSRMPEIGDSITFELLSTVGGKPRAENVLFQGQIDPRKKVVIIDLGYILFVILFFVAIIWLVVRHVFPLPIIVLYAFFSFLAFIIYKFDKDAAEYNQWRTRENTLHLLSLLCGWPGALLAQRFFRHKSKKMPFQAIFWITVILNTIALSLFANPVNSIVRGFLQSLR